VCVIVGSTVECRLERCYLGFGTSGRGLQAGLPQLDGPSPKQDLRSDSAQSLVEARAEHP
jgi:hypothetical protein